MFWVVNATGCTLLQRFWKIRGLLISSSWLHLNPYFTFSTSWIKVFQFPLYTTAVWCIKLSIITRELSQGGSVDSTYVSPGQAEECWSFPLIRLHLEVTGRLGRATSVHRSLPNHKEKYALSPYFISIIDHAPFHDVCKFSFLVSYVSRQDGRGKMHPRVEPCMREYTQAMGVPHTPVLSWSPCVRADSILVHWLNYNWVIQWTCTTIACLKENGKQKQLQSCVLNRDTFWGSAFWCAFICIVSYQKL